MATSANMPEGPMSTNGPGDPFVGTPTPAQTAAHRYASFDTEQFSMYSTNSPSQAKRALEAHLKDTDRRIQDASRLGTTLLQQRKDLSARLQDVEEVQHDNEVPADLRKKLADLEKEYNEVGKESARAFLPKARVGSNGVDPASTPSALTGTGRESPTKMTAPSRRQRNQPNNRVHDIEFATEISTSLLAQVRSLQTALAEKDDALRSTSTSKTQLEAEAMAMAQRIKHMDENEQKYKDENWNLETRLQELESTYKTSTDKEQRLTQSLKATHAEKASAQRDLDDLKLSHEKLNEEHAGVKRQHETDVHGFRRDAAMHETEKHGLQRKIDELTSQNTELAKAVSYRFGQPGTATDTDFVSADENQLGSDETPENSDPGSPVKATPRHGMLESETLKSSLNHAHRMIQNLKNNIHREKTEKIELKRMLQDSRDELETRRSDGSGVAANMKKRRSDAENLKFRKNGRPLGTNRESTTEIMEDEPDWEDHAGDITPSKTRDMSSAAGGAIAGADGTAAVMPGGWASTDTESADQDFETATERDGTDAFETGREGANEDDSDELTETESNVNRTNTERGASDFTARAKNRMSFQSTASDDEDRITTPIQAQQQKYRVRVNRGSKRDRVADLIDESPSGRSPSSSLGTPQQPGQSLGDELEGLDDDSVEGTPSRFDDTPETQRMASNESEERGLGSNLAKQSNVAILAHEASVSKPTYADASVMTDPWEPTAATDKPSLTERAGEVVGGALAGFGLGRLTGGKKSDDEHEAEAGPDSNALLKPDSDEDRPRTALGAHAPDLDSSESTAAMSPVVLQRSEIVSQETEPILPAKPSAKEGLAAMPLVQAADARPAQAYAFSPVVAEEFVPQKTSSQLVPLVPRRSSKRPESPGSDIHDPFANIPGTDAARPGAGFFATSSQKENEPVEQTDTLRKDESVDPAKSSGKRAVLGEIAPNSVSRDVPEAKVLLGKNPMSDEGSQTIVSGDDIESMLRNKSKASFAAVSDVYGSPGRPNTAIGPNGHRRSIEAGDSASLRTPRRPASAGSLRNKIPGMPPPLPEDHNQKIAAAQGGPGTPNAAKVGTMGPPLMPASAYKQSRPRTPADGSRTLSRDGTTPRNAKQMQSPGGVSRRTSVSSFASEVDERFNQRSQFMYPEGIQPATDPRMIQAITQTMIGEYLWKYTRKAGRSETSNTRHRRFFWVHPYTRTLYWSEKDPSAAGRDMLKAKSVAIEAVRSVSDDNVFPPGLHRKSLVVVTPGREIVFTAATGQRHETWFNSLSYLLLRTEAEKEEAEDTINQEDIDEFNPGIGNSIRRSISRMTGRSQSRVSLSSYNSRTTRTSSPSRGGTLTQQRQSASMSRALATETPTLNPTGTTSTRHSAVRDSSTGRLSTLTGKFKSTNAQRGSVNTVRSSTGSRGHDGAGAGIYDASVAADSAEDLRAVIERQEEDADRLENVRACCDGKHDVGSLSKRGRHASFGARFSTHAHPRA